MCFWFGLEILILVYKKVFFKILNGFCLCLASPDEEDLGAAGLLLPTYSAGPVSQICYDLKGQELATRCNTQ
jgi:hypothetical protein